MRRVLGRSSREPPPAVGADRLRPRARRADREPQRDVDHTGALGFLRGLLALLRQTGRKGLMLILDEVETIQRVRADSREQYDAAHTALRAHPEVKWTL